MYETNGASGRMEQLEHWLNNVFWYHYKWYFLAAVFALTLLVMSIVSFASRVDYDWTVVYAHRGPSDPAGAAAIEALMEKTAPDTTDNGKVQVQVLELCDDVEGPGREDLYGPLLDSDTLLYVLDDGVLKQYQSLGYFQETAPCGEPGLMAAVNDVPVTPYVMEDFAGYEYTQEQIDDANVYRQEQHELLAEEARAILWKLGT